MELNNNSEAILVLLEGISASITDTLTLDKGSDFIFQTLMPPGSTLIVSKLMEGVAKYLNVLLKMN